jgi:hypothetical protein
MGMRVLDELSLSSVCLFPCGCSWRAARENDRLTRRLFEQILGLKFVW